MVPDETSSASCNNWNTNRNIAKQPSASWIAMARTSGKLVGPRPWPWRLAEAVLQVSFCAWPHTSQWRGVVARAPGRGGSWKPRHQWDLESNRKELPWSWRLRRCQPPALDRAAFGRGGERHSPVGGVPPLTTVRAPWWVGQLCVARTCLLVMGGRPDVRGATMLTPCWAPCSSYKLDHRKGLAPSAKIHHGLPRGW
jgi:hypothetical protein